MESVIRKTLSLVKSELDLREQRRREEIERKKREEERRREEEEVPENPDTATGAYVIKLLSLKNLFDPRRTTPIDSILTESDINSLADEFFGQES